MQRMPGSKDFIPTVTSARWQRRADRLARYAWRLLLVAIAIGLAGALITAAVERPGSVDPPVPASEEECTQPPCLSLDLDRIRLRNIPGVLWLPAYMLALILGVPSLLASLWDVVHRRWSAGGRRLLTFVGPALVFVGIEIIPHLVLPCAVLPWVCEELPQQGRD